MTPLTAAYLAHLGYDGEAAPTLETLRALHRLHPQRIAFENLSPLLGEPVSLALPDLAAKLLGARRGGWCFEHNLLLKAVLEDLGFAVTGLAARVLIGQSADQVSPRSHMLLGVQVADQLLLVDVGFGGRTLTAPLRLVPDEPQPTPHGRFILRRTPDGFSLWAETPQSWEVLYRFDLQPQWPADYEYANWYLSTHPESIFRRMLMAARAGPEGRHALLNGRYSLQGADGTTLTRPLQSVPALREVLQSAFGIALPQAAQTDALLARLLQN